MSENLDSTNRPDLGTLEPATDLDNLTGDRPTPFDDVTVERPTTPPDPGESHRGAFGEFGGEERAFIDRSFRERIVLVGLDLGRTQTGGTEAALDELAALVDTAGADTVARIIQRRDAPDAATFVGKGKARQIRSLADHHDADTVVFDNELSPAQQANLDRILGRSAIDRTAVILDIFAQNAHSVEGKAQVELALLRYRLPRLKTSKRFSQQGGGIGTRGPGETQLEVDRRRIERRIHRVEAQLRTVKRHRRTQSKKRRRSSNRRVAIVGYTNAGKSTLLNQLTDAGVLAEDRLFATLDAATRRLQLPGGERIFLTDTVGFVRKLPHQLVESFRSTLDVVVDADLLIHVVDSRGHDPDGQIQAVRHVLDEIGADAVPELIVFNKCDTAPASPDLLRRYEGSVAVSALTAAGVPKLLETIGDRLAFMTQVVEVVVPFERGEVIAELHRSGQVLEQRTGRQAMHYKARLDAYSRGKLRDFVVDRASRVGQRDGPTHVA